MGIFSLQGLKTNNNYIQLHFQPNYASEFDVVRMPKVYKEIKMIKAINIDTYTIEVKKVAQHGHLHQDEKEKFET